MGVSKRVDAFQPREREASTILNAQASTDTGFHSNPNEATGSLRNKALNHHVAKP
jgi:hypothetical protein